MKMHTYARNMNLNRKCGSPFFLYLFLKNKTVFFFLLLFFFLIPNVLKPLGYLAGIMVLMPDQYFYLLSRYLNRPCPLESATLTFF